MASGRGGGRASESRRGGGGSLPEASESGCAWCRGCQRTRERWPKRRPEDWHRPECRRPGCSSQGGGRGAAGGQAEAGMRRAVRVGGGRGVGVLVRRAGDECRTACARVGSGGDGCVDCDDVDLNRVRGVGACGIFLNKVITYIDHPKTGTFCFSCSRCDVCVFLCCWALTFVFFLIKLLTQSNGSSAWRFQ
jgi:hypothetical protein